jgi:hypothetical protein
MRRRARPRHSRRTPETERLSRWKNHREFLNTTSFLISKPPACFLSTRRRTGLRVQAAESDTHFSSSHLDLQGPRFMANHTCTPGRYPNRLTRFSSPPLKCGKAHANRHRPLKRHHPRTGVRRTRGPEKPPSKKNSNLPSIPLWRRRPGVSQPSKKTSGGRQMRPAQR